MLDVYTVNLCIDDESFYTIFGLNVIENRATFSANETFNIADPYANFVFVSEFGLNINAGVRINNHNVYGSNFVYNINPSFTIPSKEGYTKFFLLTVRLI